MTSNYFKFPTTPHLATLSGVDVRSDKVMSDPERNEFLRQELTVEEKIDGANLGISYDSEGNIQAQNRGDYLHLPRSGQWKKLGEWLAMHNHELLQILSDRYILFGEWCYAQHSVFYDHLPDWFLAFDVYDKKVCQFLPLAYRDQMISDMHISPVPTLSHGIFSFPDLKILMSQSKFADEPAEGIYLRCDQSTHRAKLVRPEFIQAVGEHWSRSAIKLNRLAIVR